MKGKEIYFLGIKLADLIQIFGTIFLLIASIVSILSLFETRKQGDIIQEEFKINNRPYIVFKEPGLVNAVDYQKVADILESGGHVNLGSTTTFILTASLINVGNLPAKFKVSDLEIFGYPNIHVSKYKPDDGIIYPNQPIELGWYLSWNNRSEEYFQWRADEFHKKDIYYSFDEIQNVRIKIDYSVLGNPSRHFYIVMNNENYIFINQLQDNAQVTSREIEWKIIDSN